MADMQRFRQEIDALDEEIIRALARRFEIVREVGAHKARSGVPVMQPDRIKQIKDRCTELGTRYGVRPEFLHRMYDLIIGESCVLEEEFLDTGK